MRLQVAAPTLLVVSLAVAAEVSWPSKGDKAYIAASFKGVKPPPLPGLRGVQVNVDMPPCEEFETTKANPKKSLWIVRDPFGSSEQLEGPWQSRMHKTKAECGAQMSAEGEPEVTRAGTTHTIKPTTRK